MAGVLQGIFVRRINLFLKGNLDLRDSLHSFRLNGNVQWNGVNEIVRARFPGTTVRLIHETWNRSDALLCSNGRVPDELVHRQLPLGAHPAISQFSFALFDAKADAIILSIQPDIAVDLLRHKREGYLLYASDAPRWPQADRQWLRDTFELASPLDVSASMANFARIIERCRAQSDRPILVYNVSSIVVGDSVHCHRGLGDILSTRIKRFNLGLVELSQQTGISIVDVDTIVARHGADRLKMDYLHLNAEGCRLVAEEVVRILEDVGCL